MGNHWLARGKSGLQMNKEPEEPIKQFRAHI
jgi:hypothetical protein